MTSFIIKAQVDHPLSPSWSRPKDSSDCTFCRIVRNELPANRVYEDDRVIAILDIMPLRKGHTLVIPKDHHARVSELPVELAAATGIAVSKVANALTQALGNTALNVVCNQEYAQAVAHVHYHIIPAPTFGPIPLDPAGPGEPVQKTPKNIKEMHRLEVESRSELDDEEAEELMEKLRSRL